MQAMNMKPRFETEQIPENKKFKRTVCSHDGKTFTFAEKTEKGGYMVYFPHGHSIRVRDMAELKRLGFHRMPGVIDLETGEEVPQHVAMSLKELNSRKTRETRESKSIGGEGAEGLEELEAETEGDE